MKQDKVEVPKIKVVFLGTPEFACPTLNFLLQDLATYDMIGVITQPDRPAGRSLEVQPSRVKDLVDQHLKSLNKAAKRFPVWVPENINKDLNLHKELAKLKPDIAVVVAYGQILGPAFLKLFRLGAVNVHASLLPRWRGAAPIQWTILSGDRRTGVSLQKIAEKLDAGDIIASSDLAIDDSWDAPKLYGELSHRGADLVRKNLPNFVAGKIKLVKQDKGEVSLAPKIKKEQGLIDWKKSAKLICAQIRALSPWPGTWTTRKGKILKILRADPVEHLGEEQPGLLVGADKLNFWVKCGDSSALKVSVVQTESRSRMPVAEYLKGNPFVKGDSLGN